MSQQSQTAFAVITTRMEKMWLNNKMEKRGKVMAIDELGTWDWNLHKKPTSGDNYKIPVYIYNLFSRFLQIF